MVPRAVLYFTGEVFEDDDDFEDCDSEGDEDTEEEEEEEDGDHWRKNALCFQKMGEGISNFIMDLPSFLDL